MAEWGLVRSRSYAGAFQRRLDLDVLRDALRNLLREGDEDGELGITPSGVRTAISEGRLTRTLLHRRTSLIARTDVERYKAEHLGKRGKRMLPDEALTEQQRKQRAYQRTYYQRRKAARTQKQQPAESEE